MKRFQRTGAWGVVAALAVLLSACAGLGKSGGGADKPFDYEVITLKNGMNVITLEDHSTPIAAVQVWYHVGSKNEQPDRRGFAHMFEHMMFRGTDHLGPEDHFKYIQASGGNNNAYTAFDQTVYVQEVPSNQVELVLWLEAERMGFLRIDEEGFNTEREVVKEEYRMGAEQPYGTVADKLLAELFQGGAYSWTPIGKMDELDAATAAELQEFWNTYYVPNNATLVVAGDIKHDEVQDLAEKYFGWMPRYDDPPALAVPRGPINTEELKIKIKEKNGPAPIVGIAYRTVSAGSPDELPLELMGTILGGNESSRIYRRLVTEDALATVAMGAAFSLEIDGLAAVGAVLSPFGADKDGALTALREEIERLRAEGPTEEELEKAKNNALRDAVKSQMSISSKAQVLGSAAVVEHDLEGVNRRFDRIRAVTTDDIQRVAQEYLLPERQMEVIIEPSMLGFLMNQISKTAPEEEEETESATSTTSEGQVGKPGLVRPDYLPDTPPMADMLQAELDVETYEITLPNGLRVVAIPNHEVPYVTATLGMQAGAFTDPPEMPGAASIAYQMLTRGTDLHTYEELTDELDRYAISIAGSASMDTADINMGAVTDQLDRGMEFLAEVAMMPTFPKEELEDLITQTRTGKAIEEKNPDYLADREVRRRLYGDHPYSRSADPELADLDNITAEGLRSWYGEYARPDLSTLYIAGDVSKAKAFALATKYFAKWTTEGEAPELSVPDVPASQPTHIYLVDKSGDQSQIRIAQRGITRRDPLYFPTRILNQVLGGGFGSRLNKSIRVDKGLTYAVFGGFWAQRFAGSFYVTTFSKNESVAEAIVGILEEMDSMKTKAPTDEELDMAKKYLAGNFVISRETPQSIVGDLWMIQTQNLPDDYLRNYLAGIGSTTSEDVKSAANKLMNDDELVIVVVGPADDLKADLEKIAPVTVVK
ncbi:insulinase family protein [bacterium]|nr:insulinase family protein [bacterium]